jgi:Caspase domain
MIGRCIGFIAALALVCGFASGDAQAEPRLALVIGNSDYRDVVALPNPAKDAAAMDSFLRQAGFDVTPANNLTQSEMRGALRDFADKVSGAGPDAVALLYYAGHGVQIDGQNYLVPVDARIKREADVPVAALRLTDVMDILSAVHAKSLLVILDACSNNPFAAIDKSIGRGLAIVDAPKGSIVSYSTAPGATALDGDGNHSPFTSALIDIARTPGLPVEQTFKKVRLAVNKVTDGEQTPWESSSLVSDFAFFRGDGTPVRSKEASKQDGDETVAPGQAGPRLTAAMWRERLAKVSAPEAYDMVILADVIEGYEAFLSIYPKFEHAARIRILVDRRLEMIAWYEAVTINTVVAYETFLVRYPDSDLAATAKHLREQAKNRALGTYAFASARANDPADAAATSPKVITKIVEKPIVVTKLVEKPVVVEKIVKEVVHVPGPCECRDCGRRASRKGSITVDNDKPVRRLNIERQPRMQQFHAGAGFSRRRF